MTAFVKRRWLLLLLLLSIFATCVVDLSHWSRHAHGERDESQFAKYVTRYVFSGTITFPAFPVPEEMGASKQGRFVIVCGTRDLSREDAANTAELRECERMATILETPPWRVDESGWEWTMHSPQFGDSPRMEHDASGIHLSLPVWIPLSAIAGLIAFLELRRGESAAKILLRDARDRLAT